MEITYTQDPNSNPPFPADDDDELDLYTIPSFSSWFSWDDIHETERLSLKEFFNGSSITRTPKIYKEYRDFIISKYREDSTRKLAFSEVRKSLVGDITLLYKVFNFLEKWGLINYGVDSKAEQEEEEVGEERWNVKVEEGAPHGVRVVAAPNSLKPVVVPSVSDVGDDVEDGFKLPPLASYNDVYIEKEVICGNCKDYCDSGHYKHTKEGSFIICVNCFKSGNFGENRSANDFKFIDYVPSTGRHGSVWTEGETLLLLESVLKHGDDWERVAQNVRTKSKLDCISKLLELPFGELMLESAHGNKSGVKQGKLASSEPQETIGTEDYGHDQKDVNEQNGDDENQGPPLKRKRTDSPSCVGTSLMKQVALISTMVGPQVTASAAEAAVTALCDEIQCTREVFDSDDTVAEILRSPPESADKERALHVEDSVMEDKHTQLEAEETLSEKNALPLTIRMRAASATALGAAAAHAKLLADQEEREMEYLVATTIEMQLKKLHRKMKHLEDVELIMEKEKARMEELKESMVEERINVVQRIFNAGLSKLRNQTNVKSHMVV